MNAAFTNHLWQSTWFAILAGLLTLAFRSNRANVRFWLWLSASLKFLVPFALLIAVGSRMDRWVPDRKSSPPKVSAVVVQVSEPFLDTSTLVGSKPASKQASVNWTPAFLALWIGGFATIAFIRFRDWQRIRAVLRASKLDRASTCVEIRSAPGLLEPGVVGLVHPVLLLPEGIESRLTPNQLRAVIAHELAHVRRRDNLMSALHMIVEAIFWFHPLVWWIGGRLVQERERACDEEVLRLGSEATEYADGILNVCAMYLESPLVCVSGVTGADLKSRIRRILSGEIVSDLSLGRKIFLMACAILALSAPIIVGIVAAPLIRAQEPTPKWEVVSIRPCESGGQGGGKMSRGGNGGPPGSSPGRLTLGCRPASAFIDDAYGRFATGHAVMGLRIRVDGAPSWLQSERYSITAKAEGTPREEMMRGPMLQALLEDRFELKIHRETREIPVYELRVGKDGPKLSAAKEDGCIPFEFGKPPLPPPPPGEARPKLTCGMIWGSREEVRIAGATMTDIANQLGSFLERPVIDKTGVEGKFDIQLPGPMPELFPHMRGLPDIGDSSDNSGITIFQALKQVGLKLEPAKGPGTFIVVDHIARPTPN